MLTRLSDNCLSVASAFPSRIYANSEIVIEASALDELNNFSKSEGLIDLAFTPDFHKGTGIPIGTVSLMDRVYPRIVGNDIGCGMRLDILDLKEFIPTDIRNSLRHAFFQGGREILVKDRHAILAGGLEAPLGGYSTICVPKHSAHSQGVFGQGEVSETLRSYLDLGERDNFLGTIGGGNHFVEIQIVDEILDGSAAYALGLRKGSICVMTHSGSLELGHQVGTTFKDRAVGEHTGKKPENGFYALPDRLANEYVTAANNAANFAMVNRAVMASMVARCLGTTLRMVYDAPHNHIWETPRGYLHRKGSCPAGNGEPVIVPGSMGTKSLVALGRGFQGTMESSAHGSGRIMARNKARHESDMLGIDVITKVDLNAIRSDIAAELRKELAEESPRAYKDVTEVERTMTGAGIISPVAWLKPIMTVKG